jgi:glutathione S-transferase
MNQDRSEDAALRSSLKQQLESMEKLFARLQVDRKGPYLCGDQLSMAEVAMVPFFDRSGLRTGSPCNPSGPDALRVSGSMVPVLRHCRSFDIFNDCQLPRKSCLRTGRPLCSASSVGSRSLKAPQRGLAVLKKAYDACVARPAFQKTKMPDDLAVSFYSAYAASKKNPPGIAC